MNNAKARERFQTFVDEQTAVTHREVFELLQSKREAVEEKIREGITELLEKQDSTQVKYIHFAYLRAHILDGTYTWYVQMQNKEGDLDFRDIHTCIAMSEFFLPLEALQERLLLEAKRYVGKLSEADIDLIKLTEFDRYIPYIYLLGISTFKNKDLRLTLRGIETDSCIQITIGEYMGTRQVVYVDRQDKEIASVLLQRLYADIEEDDWRSCHLQYRHFEEYTMKLEPVVCKNMTGSSFTNCRMENMDISLCNLTGVDFDNNVIEDSDFFNCTMNAVVFCDTTIRNTKFINCRLDKAKWKDNTMSSLGIVEASFLGSTLENVRFVDCDLSNCNLENTIMSNVTFKGCNMTGTIISKENLRSNVTIVEKERVSEVSQAGL